MPRSRRWMALALAALAALATLGGCRRELADQPRAKPLGPSTFFADGAASRPIPEHTVAQGDLAAVEPPAITRAVLARGQERYEIHCAACHGPLGDGQGMVVRRGFPAPPTFHQPRLREAPASHYFEAITHGYGVMYPMRAQVPPADRWAIIAYVRALQLSQHATLAEATAAGRAELEAPAP